MHEHGAPEIVIRNERRILQTAMSELNPISGQVTETDIRDKFLKTFHPQHSDLAVEYDNVVRQPISAQLLLSNMDQFAARLSSPTQTSL